ncbi:MAG: ADP-ribosylglycohydrolase family protein [Rhodospirillales bacterium]|nr:ADP-ribosylglycohydrolase family protein [Rhodospirillales bacterium]
MATIVANSLAEKRTIDKSDLVARYTRWASNNAFDTGPTFALVFGLIKEGLDSSRATKAAHEKLGNKSAGCAPAQRITPLAACSYVPTSRLSQLARDEAAITHYDKAAGDASAIVTLICRYLLCGWSVEEIDAALNRVEPNAWLAVNQASIGPSGLSNDTVRTAWFCLTNTDDPLSHATNLAGEQNYAPPIVGAFLAAQEIGRTSPGHFRPH